VAGFAAGTDQVLVRNRHFPGFPGFPSAYLDRGEVDGVPLPLRAIAATAVAAAAAQRRRALRGRRREPVAVVAQHPFGRKVPSRKTNAFSGSFSPPRSGTGRGRRLLTHRGGVVRPPSPVPDRGGENDSGEGVRLP